MPSRLRRFLAATLAALACASAVAGCGSNEAATVRFHLSKPEAIPFFREVVADYNAHHNGERVILDTSANLQAGFVRHSPPDLVLLNYNQEMARFLDRGALSDLSDTAAAARVRKDIVELARLNADYPGRTSVVPYSVMGAGVIYNKELFAREGLSVPQTWSEFTTLCETLRARGITPIAATLKEPWTVAQGMFDYTVGGTIDVVDFYEHLRAEGAAVTPTSPVSFSTTLAEPVDKMRQIASSWINSDAASLGYGDGNLAFAQGKAAMYFQGPWALGEIAKSAPDLDVGIFPLPVTENPADLKIRVNIDLAAWIPLDSPHKAEARAFLDYICSPDIINRYNNEQLGFGPMVDSAPTSDPRIGELQGYYDAGSYYPGASQLIPLTIPSHNYIQGIALGADPRTALATLDADWARLAKRQGHTKEEHR